MKKRHGLATRLMIVVAVITIICGAAVGTISYMTAKNELIDAGKLDLQHMANSATSVIALLNERVENGEMTLEEAQEEARTILNGPIEDGVHDLSQSNFNYKNGAGYIIAYDNQANMVLHPSKEIGSPPANESTKKNREDMIVLAQSVDDNDSFMSYDDLDEKTGEFREKMAYVNYFQPWNWTVGITVYTDLFYKDLETVKYIIIGVTAGITILSLILFYFLIRPKLTQLKAVTDAATQLAAGDFREQELKETKDEIGVLSNAFTKMSGELRSLVQSIIQSSDKVSDAASELSAVSEETSASSEQVGVAVDDIANGASSQASDLETTTYHLSGFNDSISMMTAQSDAIAQAALQTSEATTKGSNMMHDLTSANNASMQSVEAISAGMQELDKNLQQIVRITDVIENITEETNLLALNASIEAARAGEHGKGFAVVASEVRKLADQSNAATKEIQQMISSITKEAAENVARIESNKQQAEQLNHSVVATAAEFTAIEAAAEATKNAGNKLLEEIKQVTSQTNDITDSIQNASSVSEETAASVEEIAASIADQIQAVANIATSAEELTHISRQLNESIAVFKL
ncbi:methyl-accepting chemotaxis sensory transducer with Cache sensor [Terribacillus saccharophilus]|uniref:Methyl-accepting chemotaxis sensory transducer with Cache sensor n=1 Tax=Terribacillus saccharophilus TaxID=361277 RepID=A0AAX2EIU9_9BACI|nr:methyl-accepting chemotaxis sensory transducer with Cache sensor [Terribacillus saccharophilus]